MSIWSTGSDTKFIQAVNDCLCACNGKNGGGGERSRYRFTPCLEHFFQLSSDCPIDLRVGQHEGLVKVSAKIDRVRRPDIFGYRVEDVQSWEFASWRRL
jgi:hypothetical protein